MVLRSEVAVHMDRHLTFVVCVLALYVFDPAGLARVVDAIEPVG